MKPLPEDLRERIRKLGRTAIDRWGMTAQMNVAQEEATEFTLSLFHFRRGKVQLEDVASEIADVIITSEQARQIVDRVSPGLVEAKITEKLDRLEKTLEELKS